jgi:hypothetical protein
VGAHGPARAAVVESRCRMQEAASTEGGQVMRMVWGLSSQLSSADAVRGVFDSAACSAQQLMQQRLQQCASGSVCMADHRLSIVCAHP